MFVPGADWQASVFQRLFLVSAAKGRGTPIQAVLVGTAAPGKFLGVNYHIGK
jgi:hypothetical protein